MMDPGKDHLLMKKNKFMVCRENLCLLERLYMTAVKNMSAYLKQLLATVINYNFVN